MSAELRKFADSVGLDWWYLYALYLEQVERVGGYEISEEQMISRFSNWKTVMMQMRIVPKNSEEYKALGDMSPESHVGLRLHDYQEELARTHEELFGLAAKFGDIGAWRKFIANLRHDYAEGFLRW